ncbi:MAG TPA: BlaI/MecI/CopY family transcriptional regulator [Longimicrobiales bacterium]
MTQPPVPTNAELEILGILWQHGPQTVKQVHEFIRETRDVGYTTVLKLMQLMTEKGLLERDESERSHVYATLVPEKNVKRKLVSDLVDRAFAGSAASLVQQLLSAKRASPEELDEIRAILDEHKKRGGK